MTTLPRPQDQTRATGVVRRLPALDGLRAVAVLLVFVHHVFPETFTGGFLGVQIFFVISGFIITKTLLAEYAQHNAISLKRFYVRRLLRLTPALVVLVFVVVGASFVLGRGVHGTSLTDGAAALAYVMNIYAPLTHTTGGLFNHTWSLAVEEQFYLIWPALLVLVLRTRRSMGAVLAVLGLGLAAVTAVLAGFGTVPLSALYRLPTTSFPVLAIGAFLAYLSRGDHRFPAWGARWGSVIVLVGTVAAGFTVSNHDLWLYQGGYVVVGVLFAVLLLGAVSDPGSPLNRVFCLAPVQWLGTRSYGFYLWHAPVILLLERRIGSPLVLGGVALLGTVVATEVSWRLVESPFLRLKRRFGAPPSDA